MSRKTAQLVFALATVFALLALPSAWSQPSAGQRRSSARAPAGRAAKKATLPCGDLFSFQVLLDRQSISPGQIDGAPGTNFTHALTALQQARHLRVSGQPDCETWHALGGDSGGSLIDTFTLSEQDVKGPFTKMIPRDLMAQATLPALGYRSALEKLAERFHVAPALLVEMNRGVRFDAGAMIRVPAVQPFDVEAKPTVDPAGADVRIQVTRGESALRATHADDTLAFFAPVTTGSDRDPLPTGDWKVTSVDWRPEFHYNPDLFWDAKPGHDKATIKPGPNNPVGVAWINLSLGHYGIHGTPEPANIGHTESHGCVRLTNWDAARLVSLVKPGTPVLFR